MFKKKPTQEKEKKGERKPKKEKKEKKRSKKPPKERSEVYILRRNTAIKVGRFVLWAFLAFIFFRGLYAIIQKNTVEEANSLIREFKAEFAEYKDDNEEMLGFAQNFAKEYLTYENRQESDYANRIRVYVSTEVYNSAADMTGAAGKATAVYAKAYRKEEYAKDQYDVYVLVDVEYEIEETIEKNGEKEVNTIIKRRPVTLKVPLYAKDGKYLVEDIPVFVSDSMTLSGYQPPMYEGTLLPDSETRQVQESVTSFLAAYYEQEQNVIEYYLAKNADKTKFQGLHGRYHFDSLENIQCYAAGNEILCIVQFNVLDSENENKMAQRLHLYITKENDRYYIRDMETRTVHL